MRAPRLTATDVARVHHACGAADATGTVVVFVLPLAWVAPNVVRKHPLSVDTEKVRISLPPLQRKQSGPWSVSLHR